MKKNVLPEFENSLLPKERTEVDIKALISLPAFFIFCKLKVFPTKG